jgi:hypothetical protein
MHDPFFPAPSAAVRAIQPIANWLNLSTLSLHIHEIVLAFLWYQFLFTVASPAVSTLFLPETYCRLEKKSKINWDIRFVSLVQSSVITVCALYVLSSDVERARMEWQERLWGYTGASGMVQALAAGYFLWDLQVSLKFVDVLGASSLLHAIGALLVTTIGFVSISLTKIVLELILFTSQRPFANYYGLNFILYELSTPFLNIHWFLDKFQMTGSRLQLLNGIMLVATFGCSRLLWGTYQSILIYMDIWTAWKSPVLFETERNSGTAPILSFTGPDATGQYNQHPLPVLLVSIYLGGNTVLTALNFYWFRKMIVSILKRFRPRAFTPGTKPEKLDR